MLHVNESILSTEFPPLSSLLAALRPIRKNAVRIVESGELIIGFFGGVAAAIAGSYVAHRYTEQLEFENRRIRTNNVLRAVATEIRIAGELYGPKFKKLFEECPDFFPLFEEAITGIDSFRQNLELITSQTESNDLVAEIIEMDQVWRLLSAEFRTNNLYHKCFREAKDDAAKRGIASDMEVQAEKIKKSYERLEEKAAGVLRRIDTYLANSKRTPIRLIPEEWKSL